MQRSPFTILIGLENTDCWTGLHNPTGQYCSGSSCTNLRWLSDNSFFSYAPISDISGASVQGCSTYIPPSSPVCYNCMSFDGEDSRRESCSSNNPVVCQLACHGQSAQLSIAHNQLYSNLAIPEAGNWGDWSPWSECSQTCGDGFRNRMRRCDDPAPLNNGPDCVGDTFANLTCNLGACARMKDGFASSSAVVTLS